MTNNEYGDFQTPPELADLIVAKFDGVGIGRILEPTCGTGVFLQSAQRRFSNAESIGVEIQEDYVEIAKRDSPKSKIVLADALVFNYLDELRWSSQGKLLIVGNLPWVTVAGLSALASSNIPTRSNIKNLSGLDAVTGKSNFDISEHLLLRLAEMYKYQDVTFSLLCKTHVARNVLHHFWGSDFPIGGASIQKIDARMWFGVSVDACLFTFDVVPSQSSPNYVCQVFADIESTEVEGIISYENGELINNREVFARYPLAYQPSEFTWRQGVKHDCSAVMELALLNPGFSNKAGEMLDVEETYLYPMAKCTDVYHGRTVELQRAMIVTQRFIGEDTSKIAEVAPKLWSYLNKHTKRFSDRKSSIYRNKPVFSVFGVGEYTFAPFKVALSGFHKEARFRLYGLNRGKPVVFDDATYLIPFDSLEFAAVVAAILNSNVSSEVLNSISFIDSKRPFTKKVLQQLNLSGIASYLDSTLVRSVASKSISEIGHLVDETALSAALANFQFAESKS